MFRLPHACAPRRADPDAKEVLLSLFDTDVGVFSRHAGGHLRRSEGSAPRCWGHGPTTTRRRCWPTSPGKRFERPHPPQHAGHAPRAVSFMMRSKMLQRRAVRDAPNPARYRVAGQPRSSCSTRSRFLMDATVGFEHQPRIRSSRSSRWPASPCCRHADRQRLRHELPPDARAGMEHGYIYALCLMIASAVCPCCIFAKRGWLVAFWR